MAVNIETFQKVNSLRKHLNEVNDNNINYYYSILVDIGSDYSFQNGLIAYKNNKTNNCSLGDFLVNKNALHQMASTLENNKELIQIIELL